MPPLTTNTKAILLLTAPLIVGRGTPVAELLTPSEYKAFAQRLREMGCEPADLLGPDASRIIEGSRTFVEPSRLQQLLGRGLQLGQAVDRWKQRAIWVVSRADPEYPRRLKARLKAQAPAVLYGCGDIDALDDGGLAVVGSRHVDEELVHYAMEVGSLVARADRAVVSGGAKGIDQAAMRGALEAGGRVCGVLTDSLERQVMTREHRDMLIDRQLILVSPYDPNAGFNRGHAMQRNKVVYALADASLVVSSDVEKGGTWAGAIEQLKKLRLVRVYVRSTGTPQRGLDALRSNGAIPWPNPAEPDDLYRLLDVAAEQPAEMLLTLGAQTEVSPRSSYGGTPVMESEREADTGAQLVQPDKDAASLQASSTLTHADWLIDAIRPVIVDIAQQPIADADLARELDIPKMLAKTWLDRLVHDDVLEKRKKPARYIARTSKLL